MTIFVKYPIYSYNKSFKDRHKKYYVKIKQKDLFSYEYNCVQHYLKFTPFKQF